MATKPKDSEAEPSPVSEEEKKPFFEMARKVLLASVGAVALAQDEMEEFIKRLVERGEIAEKDGKKLVRELVDRRKRVATKAEGEADKKVAEVLQRMNVPTKEDISALSEKISALSKKIDEFKKSA
jgi:poly(hydroxyalkanoate) granule-associated protein